MPGKKRFTSSGIEIKKVYTTGPQMAELPGDFPFTRGIHADMYRERMWTIRQYAGFSTAEASNQRYHYLLKQGTTGLSVAFDLPTQIGFDSDHVMAEGEVGKVGVAIDSLKDMEELFAGITLEHITTSMTINATAPILLAMYIALAKKQGANLQRLSGTVQNDILKEYAARGTYIYPPAPSMRLITDVFEYCSLELPKWNTISISGYHIREAGATAAQELAFTLANGEAYLKAALNKGLDIDVFAKRLSFFFNCHSNFFEEIAKFRAARRMWANIVAALGSTEKDAQKLRFHAQTGGSTLTAQQPYNNIARISYQAIAAVLGGTQSLHTNGYDEALSLPSEEAANIALRTQQIIAFESGIADTVDPLAGSYFIESLTDEIEAAAKTYLNKIDQMGGAVKAIELGYIQNEIGSSAYRDLKDVESGEKILVGVNKFQQHGKEQVKPVFKVDDDIREHQIERLKIMKKSRDEMAVQKALLALGNAARGTQNLMPMIVVCVENYATLGEVSDVFRGVFGEY